MDIQTLIEATNRKSELIQETLILLSRWERLNEEYMIKMQALWGTKKTNEIKIEE